MLVAVIPVKNWTAVYHDITNLQDKVEAYELRLDYLPHLDVAQLATLRHALTLPVIFTLRSEAQGGLYRQTEDRYLEDLTQLCQLEPDYLDVEYHLPHDFCRKLKTHYPKVKLIRSYHDFKETPVSLVSILTAMQDDSIFLYKIATFAQHTQDALRMLCFVQETHQRHCVIGLCMGEAGQCTRILGKIVGSVMSFATMDVSCATAPGQLTVDELVSRYHYLQLNRDTAIFALLGDPVTQSVGHIAHNEAMALLGANAVYIKLQVAPKDLSAVLTLCRQLPFRGFSVTMPLKEMILPLLSEVS